jgi:hypothetical protein
MCRLTPVTATGSHIIASSPVHPCSYFSNTVLSSHHGNRSGMQKLPTCNLSVQYISPIQLSTCNLCVQCISPVQLPTCNLSVQYISPVQLPTCNLFVQWCSPVQLPTCNMSVQCISPVPLPTCNLSVQCCSPVKHSHSPYRSSKCAQFKSPELTLTESQSRYIKHNGDVQNLKQTNLLLITKTFYC